MFIAAIAHKYSFPHDPFHINIPDYVNDRTWYNALMAMWDLSDVQQDVTDHLSVVGSSLSRRLRGRIAYEPTRGSNETDYLIRSIANNPSLYQCSMNQPSASNASTVSIHSGKNRYGATDSSIATTSVYNKHDAIAIVKQTASAKNYSPQYGVPRPANYFFNQDQPTPSPDSLQNEPSSRSDKMSRSETTFENMDCIAGVSNDNRGNNMQKSDSTNSVCLSTPTDDFMGIDVRGNQLNWMN